MCAHDVAEVGTEDGRQYQSKGEEYQDDEQTIEQGVAFALVALFGEEGDRHGNHREDTWHQQADQTAANGNQEVAPQRLLFFRVSLGWILIFGYWRYGGSGGAVRCGLFGNLRFGRRLDIVEAFHVKRELLDDRRASSFDARLSLQLALDGERLAVKYFYALLEGDLLGEILGETENLIVLLSGFGLGHLAQSLVSGVGIEGELDGQLHTVVVRLGIKMPVGLDGGMHL